MIGDGVLDCMAEAQAAGGICRKINSGAKAARTKASLAFTDKCC